MDWVWLFKLVRGVAELRFSALSARILRLDGTGFIAEAVWYTLSSDGRVRLTVLWSAFDRFEFRVIDPSFCPFSVSIKFLMGWMWPGELATTFCPRSYLLRSMANL